MFIDVPGAKLLALRHGDRSAQTIVGVGGWVGNSELWADPFALLSDRWSTIAYDHRGTGASVCDTESITLDALVDDVFAVMDAFGVERAVLAAESAGAMTALSAALRRPERISHLILVDGSYDDAGDPDPGWVELLLTDYPTAIAGFVRSCLPEEDVDHLIAWGEKMLLRARPEDAVALLLTMKAPGLRDRLGEITQPTLAIHGTLDTVAPVASSEYLAAAVPRATLELIEGAGHVPAVSMPEVVVDLMAGFLAENP